MRLINGGSLALQTFYVEGHNLTIVAADATPTDPIEVSSVDINLGQRCAFLSCLLPEGRV